MPRNRYGDDLTDQERCVWVKVNGVRCAQAKVHLGAEGERWCAWHEQQLLNRQRLWNRAEGIPEMSIEEHLSMQLRMAYVMVRELEFQVLDLGLSMDGFKIDTHERETREAGTPEQSYVSVKTAQLHGAHPVIVQYLREREAYHNVIKTCIGAGLAAKQLSIIERYVESLINSQMALAQELGHDPNDPTVRAAIMNTVKQQQAALSDLAPPDPRSITDGKDTP